MRDRALVAGASTLIALLVVFAGWWGWICVDAVLQVPATLDRIASALEDQHDPIHGPAATKTLLARIAAALESIAQSLDRAFPQPAEQESPK